MATQLPRGGSGTEPPHKATCRRRKSTVASTQAGIQGGGGGAPKTRRAGAPTGGFGWFRNGGSPIAGGGTPATRGGRSACAGSGSPPASRARGCGWRGGGGGRRETGCFPTATQGSPTDGLHRFGSGLQARARQRGFGSFHRLRTRGHRKIVGGDRLDLLSGGGFQAGRGGGAHGIDGHLGAGRGSAHAQPTLAFRAAAVNGAKLFITSRTIHRSSTQPTGLSVRLFATC